MFFVRSDSPPMKERCFAMDWSCACSVTTPLAPNGSKRTHIAVPAIAAFKTSYKKYRLMSVGVHTTVVHPKVFLERKLGLADLVDYSTKIAPEFSSKEERSPICYEVFRGFLSFHANLKEGYVYGVTSLVIVPPLLSGDRRLDPKLARDLQGMVEEWLPHLSSLEFNPNTDPESFDRWWRVVPAENCSTSSRLGLPGRTIPDPLPDIGEVISSTKGHAIFSSKYPALYTVFRSLWEDEDSCYLVADGG